MTTTTTTAVTDERLLTADDLLRLYGEGVRGELIRGVLYETMPPGTRHGKVAARLIMRLGVFVEDRALGTVLNESGVWIDRDPDTVRGPDVAFIPASRMALDADVPGYTDIVPDLVVEVRSPNDTRRAVHDKARMWISHGVRLVWAVYPEARAVDVHRPGAPVATLGEGDDLDGLDVLPGFTCTVSDVFGA